MRVPVVKSPPLKQDGSGWQHCVPEGASRSKVTKAEKQSREVTEKARRRRSPSGCLAQTEPHRSKSSWADCWLPRRPNTLASSAPPELSGSPAPNEYFIPGLMAHQFGWEGRMWPGCALAPQSREQVGGLGIKKEGRMLAMVLKWHKLLQGNLSMA